MQQCFEGWLNRRGRYPLRRQHNLVPNGIAFLYGWQLKHEVHKGFWLGVEGLGSADIFGARGPSGTA